MKRCLTIFAVAILFLSFSSQAKAEKVLAEGNIYLLSCSQIYDRFFILYSRSEEKFGQIYLKELDLNWNEIGARKLGIEGFSAHLTSFNNKFYVSYTSFEKEGNVRIAEFDLDWNLLRDILVTPTPYDGEVAYQLIPLDDNHLYLFYARNWVNNCGFKMIEFNQYLELVKETALMDGEVNFHVYADEFSSVYANSRFYIAYKKSHPQKGMDIFVNEYSLSGELINKRCIDQQEKLSPSLFFNNGLFYLAYEGYDYNLLKAVVYVKVFDTDWNLLKKTRIVLQETRMPSEKSIIVCEGRCYLVSRLMEKAERYKIFVKEINFDQRG